MAEVAVTDDVSLADPTLVEGLPGTGLVGKIAIDHLIEQLDMRHYGTVRCDGLPRIAVYQPGERQVHAPVRLYADEAHDLLALQSEVPISAEAAPQFADCLTEWLLEQDATAVYLSGYGAEDRDTPPQCFGVSTGDAAARLDDLDVDRPSEPGAVAGPTGALLAAADQRDLDAVGLVVETNPQFPDPEAARVLLDRGVGPLADVAVDLEPLLEQAEEIQETRQQLAQAIRQREEESTTEAKPLRMFQ